MFIKKTEQLVNNLQKQFDKASGFNPSTSTKAIFLYTIESHIVLTAFNYLVDNGIIKYDVVNGKNIYKGISFEGDGMKILGKLEQNIINELNIYVNKHFNIDSDFKIQFVNKTMEEYYDDEEIAEIKEYKLYDYEDAKTEFEMNNFKLNNPLCFIEINKNTNEFNIHSEKVFMSRYRELKYEVLDEAGEKKKEKFIDKWLDDENKRVYDKIEFVPQGTTPDYIYNSFRGFEGATAPNNNNDFRNSYMYQHFRNNICCNNDQKEEYLTKWIANLLQDPINKTRTAMILQSKQGTGKDKFVELLQLLLGEEHYINTADTKLIFGKFNKLIENKILCVFNETQGKDTYEINEKIKDAITRKKLNMERKGHDPIVLNDALHYIFLSNNNNPIKVPPDDRRLFVIEVGEGNRNDEDFFQ